ncbi:E3 ubiquitin-protein ligase RNF25 [Malaclemys terrapin pileata]|uniref:E3 ubiquitin-protein ligase RNF25 n=1 Tax=Malaclemys terrapin pileata TaxID=2991368 RepID=UPI0023A8ADF8|nr:E3 ubiquitin-protein ligase RNF25 [Malaclemys terrapin pileata]
MAAASKREEEAAADWALPSEVEVLESIYLDELQVSRGNGRSVPWEICITLHPATAEDQDSQYVCFTLVLSVPPQYPNEVPKISIRNPRGLSDEQIQKISQTLGQVAEAGLGTAVLYELIEKGKEILTDNNIPHGQCVICLYGFQEREAFTKTQCYHYFHSHCLARYAQHMEEEIHVQQEEREQHLTPPSKQGVGVQCPVCRETLTYDLSALQAAPPPQHPVEPYRPDAKALQTREELLIIYQRQQKKGGIIDPEAERNRYFISLQAPPAAADPGHGAAPATEQPCQLPAPERAAEPVSPPQAPAVGTEPGQLAKASVPLEPQNKRERHRGERPGFPGQGRQPYSDPQAAAAETCRLLCGSGGPGGFDWRPERREDRSQRPSGGYSQEFPKPHGRGRVAAFAGRKESGPAGILPGKGALDSKEEHPAVGRWTPEQGAETQSREKENLALNQRDPRAPTGWQGHHRTWDCGRWEKSRGRERGSYPRAPRGRGAFRPSARRDPHGQVKEDGS